jgi:hypothetical protein
MAVGAERSTGLIVRRLSARVRPGASEEAYSPHPGSQAAGTRPHAATPFKAGLASGSAGRGVQCKDN